MDAETQRLLIQLGIFAATQAVIIVVLWARTRAALAKQNADFKQQLVINRNENERKLNEAALIREQGHRDEQKARAEIEKQLIESNNRFADEIKASRESNTQLFSKVTDVLDKMSLRQETAATTHARNGEKIDALGLQIKAGFDKNDLVQGEHLTQLNSTYTHIGEESQRVIDAVGSSKLEIVTKLAGFDPTAETIKTIAGDVTEVMNNVRDLQMTYDEAIPKIIESLQRGETKNTNLAESLADLMELVGAISKSVTTTTNSVGKIEEHIQALQREMLLKRDEPPSDEADTEEMPILPGSGDIPPQGGE